MKPPDECRKPSYHEMHLCILQHLDAAEAERLAAHPEFRCRRCQLAARQAKNLCSPVKIDHRVDPEE